MMLILSREEVRRALPMNEMIAATKEAYAALSAGNAVVPQRIHLPIKRHEAMSLIMPAYLQHQDKEALAVKTVSVFPHNAQLDLAVIHGAVLVLDSGTGSPAALLEGGSLTAIRTGAASGAATDLLARPNSRVAAVFGAGVQSRTQLEAICTVRPIEKVLVFDTLPATLEKFIAEMAGYGPIPADVQGAANPQEAVSMADVICCATSSGNPVFEDQHIKPGAHINGVGSFTPHMQEMHPQTLRRAALYVDYRSAALSEAGDIIQPIKEGIFGEDHIQAELGEVVNGIKPARVDADQITVFKSVGVAVQDAAAARLALENAREMGLGQEVQL